MSWFDMSPTRQMRSTGSTSSWLIQALARFLTSSYFAARSLWPDVVAAGSDAVWSQAGVHAAAETLIAQASVAAGMHLRLPVITGRSYHCCELSAPVAGDAVVLESAPVAAVS